MSVSSFTSSIPFIPTLERPPCSQCGAQMMLTRIVPSVEPGTNQRSFKCNGCGHAETVQVKQW
jgi:hypothetical protein